MPSILQDVFNSIFEEGTNAGLVKAMHLSFFGLWVVLIPLAWLTRNIHVYSLFALSVVLWLSINWFIRELKVEEAARAAREQQQSGQSEEQTREDTPIEERKDI